MPDRPTYRPVYKAIHRPLTVCGVDRRLFFLALILGAATFNLFYSFLAGLLMFGGLYGFALWATRRDPDVLLRTRRVGASLRSHRGVVVRCWARACDRSRALLRDLAGRRAHRSRHTCGSRQGRGVR